MDGVDPAAVGRAHARLRANLVVGPMVSIGRLSDLGLER